MAWILSHRGHAVANGLPYIDALRAVTVNPLAIWGRGGSGRCSFFCWGRSPMR